ncbi:MAG: hypothetical protein MK088_06590 [Alteromonas sp.]|nr:hypothetical protein [Gammaproteobacteria bacterium]MCH2256281.1 hypothetical protein [Alteromonas sp.]
MSIYKDDGSALAPVGAGTKATPIDSKAMQSNQQSQYSDNGFSLPLYQNMRETRPTQSVTLAQFVELMLAPSVGDKDSAKLLTPYTAQGKRLENALNAQFCSLVIDHDEDDLTRDQIKAIYDAYMVNYLAFTSSYHQQDKNGKCANRWKVLIPLSTNIGYELYSKLAQGLTLHLNADKAQTNLQQGFYAPNKLTSDAPYETIVCLDLAEFDPTSDTEALTRDALNAFKVHEAKQQETAKTATVKPRKVSGSDGRIIELVEQAYGQQLGAIIQQFGNKQIGKRFLSPNSTSGTAGIIIFTDDKGKTRVYSHHGESDPLSHLNHGGHSLDTFDVLCTLKFGGDVKKAIAHYANELDQQGQKERQRIHAERLESPYQGDQESVKAMFNAELPKTKDVNILNPPGLAGKICEFIKVTAKRERPELYPLAALHLMALIGKNRESEYTSKLNLMTLGIAETAAGKEAAQNAIKTLANNAGNSKYIHGNAGSFKELITNLVDGDGASLYIVDEVHSLLGAMKNKNAQTYETKMEAEILTMSATELYSFRGMEKKPLTTEYKAKLAWAQAELEKAPEDENEVCKLESYKEQCEKVLSHLENGWPNPFFSMMGHSVPDRLDSFANPENIASGLLGRMLVVRCPDNREKLKREKRNKLLEASLKDEILYSIDQIQSDRRIIGVTDEAHQFINECIDWYDEDEQLNDPVIGGIYARAPEQLMKVASILGLDGGEIKLKHAQYAHTLVKSSVEDIKYLILKGHASRTDAEETTVLLNAKQTILRNCKGGGLALSKVYEKVKSCSGIKELQAKDGRRDITQELITQLIDTNHLEFKKDRRKERYITIAEY